MSRFLFTTLPSNDLGLLTRSLPIARKLKLRGHEVAYCHPAKSPQIFIAEGGFQTTSENALLDRSASSRSRVYPEPSGGGPSPFVAGWCVLLRSQDSPEGKEASQRCRLQTPLCVGILYEEPLI